MSHMGIHAQIAAAPNWNMSRKKQRLINLITRLDEFLHYKTLYKKDALGEIQHARGSRF